MPGLKAEPITLTKTQFRLLKKVIYSRSTPQYMVTRAWIIIKASNGCSNTEISKLLHIDRETVRIWRKRWNEALIRFEELEQDVSNPKTMKKYEREIAVFLEDLPRSGAPSRFTAEQVAQIIAMACEPPERYNRSVSHWTPRELADEASKQKIVDKISSQTVRRFLKREQT